MGRLAVICILMEYDRLHRHQDIHRPNSSRNLLNAVNLFRTIQPFDQGYRLPE